MESRIQEYYQSILATRRLGTEFKRACQTTENLQKECSNIVLNEFRSLLNIQRDETTFIYDPTEQVVNIIRKVKANRLTMSHLVQPDDFFIKEIEGREINNVQYYTITYIWSPST